jgi:hypothetical protein
MKLATIALASAFALSSTFALASTKHHRSGVKTHHGSYTRMQPTMNYGGNNYGWNNYGWNNSGWNNYGWNNYRGGPNSRGGLVGGSDAGTYRP